VKHHLASFLGVDYFAECIEKNNKPFNDGEAGLQVVKMLEAADKSLKDDSRKIRLSEENDETLYYRS